MSLSITIYIGFAAVVAVVVTIVLTEWRRRRKRGDDDVLSEMATHLWNLPPLTPPPEVTSPLDLQKEKSPSPEQGEDSAAGGLQPARKESEALLNSVSKGDGAARARPEAAQPKAHIPSVERYEGEAEGSCAENWGPEQRPRVMDRRHLMWEVVGAEIGVPTPESGRSELNLEDRQPALQSVTEKLNESVKKQLAVAASAWVEQTRGRVQNEVFSALETFGREVDARLRTLEEVQVAQWVAKLQAEMIEQTQEQINDIREGRHDSLRSLSEELDGRVKKQLDVAASGLVEETRRRLQNEVFSALETFSREVGARPRSLEEEQVLQSIAKLRADVTLQVQEQLDATRDVACEARQQLSSMADRVAPLLDNKELILRSALELEQGQAVKQHADATIRRIDLAVETATGKLRTFEHQMEASFRGAVDALRKTCDDLVASSARRLGGQANETAERLSEETRSLQTRLVDEANKQLAATIQAPLESMTTKVEAITEECRRQLRQELAECVRHSAQELETDYRKLLEKQRESVQRLFDEQLVAAAQGPRESFKREAQGIIEECRGRLRQEVDAAMLAAVSKLEAEHERFLERPQQPALRAVELHGAGPPDLRAPFTQPRQVPTRLGAAVHATLRVAVWLLPVAPLFLFVALSMRPVMRLRSDPPGEFFDPHQESSATQRAIEEHLAHAYWDSAIRFVEPKYEFGTDLPDRPLPEFKIEGTGARAGTSKSDSDARGRYWRKLRQVWTLPQAWEKSYVWDTGWIDAALASLQRAGRQLVGGTP